MSATDASSKPRSSMIASAASSSRSSDARLRACLGGTTERSVA
jgi:hypothetical protein